ncbi:hypothetical protein [Streptomyces spiramenti]|uniref:hypothetical protein n=1 Tax=Streptomyces spiramenti TaxID=2720606 RepID=UPI00308431DA
MSTWEALAWFTGEARADRAAAESSPQRVLDTFRAHSDAVAAASVSARLAKDRRRAAIPSRMLPVALLEADRFVHAPVLRQW